MSKEKKFIPPYRVGKKQKIAIIDGSGKEVVVFAKGLETLASDVCEYLNHKNYKT